MLMVANYSLWVFLLAYAFAETNKQTSKQINQQRDLASNRAANQLIYGHGCTNS